MELSDILRIACLLDHHRTECTDNAERVDSGNGSSSPSKNRWVSQAGECMDLRQKLLAGISRRQRQ
jgi:hypothetical protein